MAQKRGGFALYLRIFLGTGIPFGLVMGLVIGLQALTRRDWSDAIWIGALAGLAAGALFGLIMAAILGTVALMSTRDDGPGALAVKQSCEIQLRGDRLAVLQRVVSALAGLPRAGTPTVDEADGLVEVRTGWSWKSFGEIVTARVESDATGDHRILVASRPKMKMTIVDYGANAQNVVAVVAALAPGD